MGKVLDGALDPYITEKNVIMCRSGIQYYRDFELTESGLDMKGHEAKKVYAEYRPASVVVKAKNLMKRLPITKEHPSEWVTPDNWSDLARGTTGESVDVVALDDGEIGIETSLIFNTNDIYNYYNDGNKEVSLGYTVTKRWATEEERKKYGADVMLTGITAVNHLAVTAAGRGGKSVAIIDSICGGIKQMRTGLFWFLGHKDKQADASFSFSKTVFDHLGAVKTGDTESLKKELGAVTDSIAFAKDSDDKTKLINMVQDCFENPEKAAAEKDAVSNVLDSCYISVSGSSVAEIQDAMSVKEPASKKDAGADKECADKAGADKACGDKKEQEDTDGKGKNTVSVADSDSIRLLIREEIKAALAGAPQKDSVPDACAPVIEGSPVEDSLADPYSAAMTADLIRDAFGA